MNTALQNLIKKTSHLDWKTHFPLAPLTYFKIGGPAEAFVRLASKKDIQTVMSACEADQIPLTFLGGGSNVVVADKGITGVVVSLAANETGLLKPATDTSPGLFRAEAGIQTAMLVRATLDAKLAGLEYFLGVPGNLGGAVYNNAHYLEHLLGEHITQVEVVSSQGSRWLSHDECDFSYDHSRFHKTKECIFQVEFELAHGDVASSQQLIAEATRYRASTQPLGEASSGCIFQNTPVTPELLKHFPQLEGKSYAGGGFLIDQAGLKGTKVGDIEVSDKHAAFFINKGNGNAADVKKLVTLVKQQVKEKFGVVLKEEVFYLQ